MKIRLLLTALFICWMLPFPGEAQADIAPQIIQMQLKGPFLMLRGMYYGDKLKFDAQGNLIGTSKWRVPFLMSAVHVKKVKVNPAGVRLYCERQALIFPGDKMKVVNEGGELTVEVARDPLHPEELRAALARVFSVGFDRALLQETPLLWQSWLRQQLGVPDEVPPTGVYDLHGPIQHPKLIGSPPVPHFSRWAREYGLSGIVVMGLIVDASGRPEDIHVIRPLGLGLDEEAAEELTQWRFRPATQNGQPVPVHIALEVNFSVTR